MDSVSRLCCLEAEAMPVLDRLLFDQLEGIEVSHIQLPVTLILRCAQETAPKLKG